MAEDRDQQLLSVGKQCSHPSCSLVDFLPFKCQHCEDSFCQEHFKVEDHVCPKYDANKHDRIAPSCTWKQRSCLVYSLTLSSRPLMQYPSRYPTWPRSQCAHGTSFRQGVLRHAREGSEEDDTSLREREMRESAIRSHYLRRACFFFWFIHGCSQLLHH